LGKRTLSVVDSGTITRRGRHERMQLGHFSLFTGIGGIDLSAEWAGFTTVGQCEYADYPTKVLEKHWPDVPRWRDIRSVTKESFTERTGLQTVDLISGGFPCQPHSEVGKQDGENDRRHLWPELMRVVREIRPRCVLAENVNGILSTVYESVCSDLERANYIVQTYAIPAFAVGAHHERYRILFVGISKDDAGYETDTQADPQRARQEAWKRAVCEPWDYLPGTYWAAHQPPVCGMDAWPAGRMDRYKYKLRMMALGNVAMPQVVYPILKAIAEIERNAE
jgi:DNA (cytosine-5)-methyltransferase 1